MLQWVSTVVNLTRTKSVDDILAVNAEPDETSDQPGETGRLKKSLGALDLMGFGIGIVIGTDDESSA